MKLLYPTLVLALIAVATAVVPALFRAEDNTHISVYARGGGRYGGPLCANTITFSARAAPLAGRATNALYIKTTDLSIGGEPCTSNVDSIRFTPIGLMSATIPTQWLFQHGTKKGQVFELKCGSTKRSMRFGYLNDVSLSNFGDKVPTDRVYLDFAVVPRPKTFFAFCSYVSRPNTGGNPVMFAPFPTQKHWDQTRASMAA